MINEQRPYNILIPGVSEATPFLLAYFYTIILGSKTPFNNTLYFKYFIEANTSVEDVGKEVRT